MRVASGEFASDPCSTMKRGAMVRAARALLSSVTRLLIIADMVDVHLMLKSLRIVRSFINSFIHYRVINCGCLIHVVSQLPCSTAPTVCSVSPLT